MIKIDPPVLDSPPVKTIVESIRANARAHPDKLAVVCGDNHLNWGAFDARINKVANLLLGMGLQKGDTIAVISPNSIPYAELFMGILRAGGCVTPLSSMASSDALHKMLTDCGARAIFVADQYRNLVEGFLPSLPIERFAIDFTHPDAVAGDRWVRCRVLWSS